MSLPTSPLGRSGMHITRLGFGSWAVGGGGWAFGWGPQDDEASLATMRHAIDAGINWIDTAAVYGLGHSEEIVGQLLRRLPASDRPFVFTKCGLVWNENDRMADPQRVLRPESIRRECEASLRRLGVERIDLYQFHWPDETGTPVEDSWAAIVKLIDEGKIRAAGVSNFDVRLLERCEAVRHVDSLQPPFSLINRFRRRTRDSLVRQPRHGRHLLQPYAVRPPHRELHDGSRRRSAGGRLAAPGAGIPAATPRQEPGAARRAPTDCEAPRHISVGGGNCLDTRVARCERGDCRRAHAGAGGRLDWRRVARPDGVGSRRDRASDRQHDGRRWTLAAGRRRSRPR